MTENCFHCGQATDRERVAFDNKIFCCQGCKSVYEILNINQLSDFYNFNRNAGVRPSDDIHHFDYLDTPEIFERITDFSEGDLSLVTFKIPVIHCSSCIWLLESLQTLNPNIKYSTVNFTRKTVQISFNHKELPLSALASFLTGLGYRPVISLETADQKEERTDRGLLLRVAVAGFAFGNGMFLTFPEYWQHWGGDDVWLDTYKPLFRWILFLFSLPVVLYSAQPYYKGAWHGLKNGRIVIEVPMVLGILVLFFRSVYEVATDYGSGYFDTLFGLLFFMLLGKIFQQRTYSALSYDRDYKSFYPIAVTRINHGKQENILLSELQVGDRILVRNQEIIPVDAILISGDGNIDNSFITGESATVTKNPGDKIFAGGKQVGAVLELEVIKNVDQSYLTQLWNKEAFRRRESNLDTLTNKISQYFTPVLLLIATGAGIYWSSVDTEQMFQVISAILIIACPCALALSGPFTFGHIMRIMGRNKFYVKDALTVERMARVDTIVFDKTGTITYNKKSNIRYSGQELSEFDLHNIKSMLKNSNHPLSKSLYEHLNVPDEYYPVEQFSEVTGKGYEGTVRGHRYKIGSASFTGAEQSAAETAVYIAIDGNPMGKFSFKNEYRTGMAAMFNQLGAYEKHLLSGDNDSEAERLQQQLPHLAAMRFNQTPEDKLEYIDQLQQTGKNVCMVGDGLNDAGALKQSNVGIAVADDNNAFTPSSDVIMTGSSMRWMADFFALSKDAMKIVKITYGISLLYNTVGVTAAVLGYVSPLFAAILMPASTISVVSFTTAATRLRSRRYFRSKPIQTNLSNLETV